MGEREEEREGGRQASQKSLLPLSKVYFVYSLDQVEFLPYSKSIVTALRPLTTLLFSKCLFSKRHQPHMCLCAHTCSETISNAQKLFTSSAPYPKGAAPLLEKRLKSKLLAASAGSSVPQTPVIAHPGSSSPLPKLSCSRQNKILFFSTLIRCPLSGRAESVSWFLTTQRVCR